MSLRVEPGAKQSGDDASATGDRARPSGLVTPAQERSAGASGQLPKRRGQKSAALALACSSAVVAVAAAFVTCGAWQAWTLIGRAQQIAQDAVGTRATTVAPGLGAPPASAVPAVAQAPQRASPAREGAPHVRAGAAAAQQGPVLTATESSSSRDAVVRTFEALAEASENVVAVGIDTVLDDEKALTLGQPPPVAYPRVDCEDIFVYIVTIAEGKPLQSSASIGVGKSGPARFRGPGQKVGDWTLLAITDDWTGLNPHVWLEKDGLACRAELAGNPTRVHQSAKPPPRRAKARHRRSRRR